MPNAASTPREIDTRLAELYDAASRAEQAKNLAENQIHSVAGDKRVVLQGRRVWRRTLSEVLRDAKGLAASGDYHAHHAAQAVANLDAALARQAELGLEILGLTAFYEARRWNRYFLVTNANGHVHRGTNCSTCWATTEYAWLPELADCDEDEMIAEFGEKACTVCFPDAPANPHFSSPGRRDREALDARAAEKAARQAVKDAKRLASDEVFRASSGDRVETVAALKDLIRKPVETDAELAWYKAGKHNWDDTEAAARVIRNLTDILAGQQADAELAASLLLTREARHEGWGATQAQIDKIVASKTKSAARAWA